MKETLVSTLLATLFVAGTGSIASAQQANCGMWQDPNQRAACYQQQMQIYREEQGRQQEIEEQLRQTHENTGRALGYVPYVGRKYFKPAWNYPRYGYDAYNYYNQ